MKKKELWIKLYQRFDGRFDDAITELTDILFINRSLKAKITVLENKVQNYKELLKEV